MHGRIYQLIEESKTGQFDRISADTFDYEDFFLREVADYVDDVEPEHYDYEQEVFFKNVTELCTPYIHLFYDQSTVGFILRDGFREKYFEKNYETFLHCLEDLNQNASLQAFAKGEFEGAVLRMEAVMDDKFGSYVVCSDWSGDIETLDHFMRYTAKPDVRYNLENILDYHW